MFHLVKDCDTYCAALSPWFMSVSLPAIDAPFQELNYKRKSGLASLWLWSVSYKTAKGIFFVNS